MSPESRSKVCMSLFMRVVFATALDVMEAHEALKQLIKAQVNKSIYLPLNSLCAVVTILIP